MEYRPLGQSDVKVSAITFGAWAIGGFMWGGSDETEAVSAIRTAIDLGVTSIDTAPIYGMGRSEQIVGQAVGSRRDKVQILTKFGLAWEGAEGVLHFEMPDAKGRMVRVYKNARRKRVMEECEASLRNLGTDYIDVYQQHWPDESTAIEETMEALDKLLRQGKIRAAGLSNYSPEQVEQARQVVPIASVQPPYSMVNRGIEKSLVPYCVEHQIGLIVYSPLQRGLLTGKITPATKFPPGDHRASNGFFSPENRVKAGRLLDAIRPIAGEHKATLAQVVIAWTIQRPGITAALVGARNPAQARENAAAANLTLSRDETRRIDEIAGEMYPV